MPDVAENTNCAIAEVLPVTWATFQGQANPKGRVDLNWATSQEELTSHFEVEHSTDGLHYDMVGTVVAAGNSSVQRDYDFEHAQAVTGANYYRLRQVDVDGNFSYSDVVSVMLEAGATPLAFPNPATREVNVKVDGNRPFRVYDQSGRGVTSGITAGQVRVDELKPGKYYLRVDGITYPFVKQ